MLRRSTRVASFRGGATVSAGIDSGVRRGRATETVGGSEPGHRTTLDQRAISTGMRDALRRVLRHAWFRGSLCNDFDAELAQLLVHHGEPGRIAIRLCRKGRACLRKPGGAKTIATTASSTSYAVSALAGSLDRGVRHTKSRNLEKSRGIPEVHLRRHARDPSCSGRAGSGAMRSFRDRRVGRSSLRGPTVPKPSPPGKVD
jgi:hypothetical protein